MHKFIKSFFIWSFKDWFWFHFIIRKNNKEIKLNTKKINTDRDSFFKELRTNAYKRKKAYKLKKQYNEIGE